MNEEVIRTKRIELYDDQDNLTGVLDGGVTIEDGERSQAGLILYGPDGPGSFASISMHGESGRPSVCTPSVTETSSSTSTTKERS
jgi:hypothetical protein